MISPLAGSNTGGLVVENATPNVGGLTLTAADYVILYDPWWNPAVERQAIDRTHRIGQVRPVTAYRMVTAGSVEEKIRALAERKTALSRAVVKADSAVAKTLTREDLAFLFADPE